MDTLVTRFNKFWYNVAFDYYLLWLLIFLVVSPIFFIWSCNMMKSNILYNDSVQFVVPQLTINTTFYRSEFYYCAMYNGTKYFCNSERTLKIPNNINDIKFMRRYKDDFIILDKKPNVTYNYVIFSFVLFIIIVFTLMYFSLVHDYKINKKYNRLLIDSKTYINNNMIHDSSVINKFNNNFDGAQIIVFFLMLFCIIICTVTFIFFAVDVMITMKYLNIVNCTISVDKVGDFVFKLILTKQNKFYYLFRGIELFNNHYLKDCTIPTSVTTKCYENENIEIIFNDPVVSIYKTKLCIQVLYFISFIYLIFKCIFYTSSDNIIPTLHNYLQNYNKIV